MNDKVVTGDIKIFTDRIEPSALEQINALMSQETFKDSKVRIMPDVHAGKGCVIGFTADMGKKVIPNIVGVDIGCGMLTLELGRIEIDFEELDIVVRNCVPSGREIWFINDGKSESIISRLRCKDKLQNMERLYNSLGTLGGGNHFIEVDQDKEGNKYLIIHTGSRNLGKQVADYYQGVAIKRQEEKIRDIKKELIDKYKVEGREKELSEALKREMPHLPKEFCYLEGQDREDYLHDMLICQKWAYFNRKHIGESIIREMDWKVEDWFETVHNYVDIDANIVRKGAVSAKEGERLLIPINMRDGCIVGRGKGNSDWNCSAPHGAGRVMGRKEASRTLSMEDFTEDMKGIYTTTVNESTLDESPRAYKPIGEIISAIKDTVTIEKIIKPIYNFKASE